MRLKKLSQQDRIDWIRLARSENVGAVTFKKLIEFFKTPKEALNNVTSLAQRGGRKNKIKIIPEAMATKEIDNTIEYDAKIILPPDPEYPKLLLNTHDYPSVLTIKGNSSFLNQSSVAIVGARNASANGCRLAGEIAKQLTDKDFIVISGLAKGIDTYAHLGSINRKTIAVIAGGIDHIYPKENEKLYHEIIQDGLIVTECPIGSAPLAKHFPQRNRIISGISLCTAIIEAAHKSGSLITARFALEQGKEIFAMPGSVLDPRCQGTNKLIKEGAHLLESADDITLRLSTTHDLLSDVGSDYEPLVSYKLPDTADIEKYRDIILSKISYSPTSIDDIIEQLDIPVNLMNIIVVELELAGRIERSYGNKVYRV